MSSRYVLLPSRYLHTRRADIVAVADVNDRFIEKHKKKSKTSPLTPTSLSQAIQVSP
jgi:hypothetical protein